jgi:hypothetical protein
MSAEPAAALSKGGAPPLRGEKGDMMASTLEPALVRLIEACDLRRRRSFSSQMAAMFLSITSLRSGPSAGSATSSAAGAPASSAAAEDSARVAPAASAEAAACESNGAGPGFKPPALTPAPAPVPAAAAAKEEGEDDDDDKET